MSTYREQHTEQVLGLSRDLALVVGKFTSRFDGGALEGLLVAVSMGWLAMTDGPAGFLRMVGQYVPPIQPDDPSTGVDRARIGFQGVLFGILAGCAWASLIAVTRPAVLTYLTVVRHRKP